MPYKDLFGSRKPVVTVTVVTVMVEWGRGKGDNPRKIPGGIPGDFRKAGDFRKVRRG